MNSEKKHIIEKVFLEVNASNEVEALRIKNNVSLYAQEKLFPILEEVFEEYNNGTDIIRFDRLDIDFALQDWDDEDVLKYNLIESFKAQVNRSANQEKREFEEHLSPVEGTKQIVDRQQNCQSAFLFFIKYGYLPWFGKQEYISELIAPDKWRENLADAKFLFDLRKLLQDEKRAVERLVLQFSGELILDLVDALNDVKFKNKSQLLNFISRSEYNFGNHFLQNLVMLSVQVFSKKQFLLKMLEIQFDAEQKEAKSTSAIAEKIKSLVNSLSPYFSDETKTKYFTYSENEIIEIAGELSEIENNTIPGKGSDESANSILNKKSTILNAEFVSDKNQLPFFDKGSQNVLAKNAGLVILGPFLPAFFKQFGWGMEQGKFRIDSRIKAVQSLHFLATGETSFFEADLIVEKFLCGVSLETPIPRQSLLGKEVLDEGNNLLHQIIKNWPALKNTRPDGLRQMFLNRNGKLIQTKLGFKLIVERKAQDILLDKLQWNISLLKLPWKNEMLFIEW